MSTKVARILDASANRAREALRVMEDAARFLLDDAKLARDLKRARHDLAAAIRDLPAGCIELSRDTPGDVGVSIKTRSEKNRSWAGDVAIAAGKRLSEALRTIEEFTKLPPRSTVPARIESLRYRGYELERRLHALLSTGMARQWKLCVLVSENLCPDGNWKRVVKAAGGLASPSSPLCIQLREKALDAGELLDRAKTVVDLCRPRGVSVIINDRPDVAMASNADGVHVGQSDLPVSEVRRLFGRQILVGASTSNLKQAKAALRAGADYCGVGPMFPTTTKHKPILAGPKYLRQFIKTFPGIPHLAIGGINPGNIATLVKAGCGGVAVSGAVCGATDPRRVMGEILDAMSE